MEFNQGEEHIIQNLIDAGCDEKFISVFFEAKKHGNPDQILLLQEQRDLILEKIHQAKKILKKIEEAIEILPEDGQ